LLAQVIETGQPIMVDLLTNQAGTFLVSRVPLRDADGHVIGTLGMVLMDQAERADRSMQPLIVKSSCCGCCKSRRSSRWAATKCASLTCG
jgi:hypothetical protein